jgi:hypothetical protein
VVPAEVTVMDGLRLWSNEFPLTAGMAGIVGFLPFSESLELCTGGAPPTAEDMLEGSDAWGVEEEIVEVGGSEIRPWAARFDPVD